MGIGSVVHVLDRVSHRDKGVGSQFLVGVHAKDISSVNGRLIMYQWLVSWYPSQVERTAYKISSISMSMS